MTRDRHVVIIGAGIVGLCTADSLLARGFRVTILDQDSAPGNGCSYGNGGIIVPSHFVPLAAPGMVALGLRMMLNPEGPFGIAPTFDFRILAWMVQFAFKCNQGHVERCSSLIRDLNLASRELYAQLASEFPEDIGFQRNGLLMLSQTEKGHQAEVQLSQSAAKLGLKATLLDAKELQLREPNLTMDVHGAVYFEDDAHVTTTHVMHALRKRLVDRGAIIRDGINVTGFSKSGSTISSVEYAGGTIEGDEFVLAAGAWSGELARQLNLTMPMVAGKGYGTTVAHPPEQVTIPAILTEARIAVTPMLDGVRFVGTFEVCKPVATPANRRVEAMKRNVQSYYPQFTPEVLGGPVWCGLRPCSPDGLPYVGRTAKVSNLVIASGHAMMGMSLGPITGKLVAEVLTGDLPTFSLALLSPDRYA